MRNVRKLFGLGIVAIGLLAGAQASAQSSEESELPQAASDQAIALAPRFAFDDEVCWPAPAIYSDGTINPGLEPFADMNPARPGPNRIPHLAGGTDGCRDQESDLAKANTYHRSVCMDSGSGDNLCAHVYSIYTEKDQITGGAAVFDPGHRHDWEHAVVWTTNGAATDASVSAHGKLTTRAMRDVETSDGHVLIVSHKDAELGIIEATASLRFADRDEVEPGSENWYTPAVANWWEMEGRGDDGASNEQLRNTLASKNFGGANFPLADRFLVSVTDREVDPISDDIPDGYGDVAFWERAIQTEAERAAEARAAPEPPDVEQVVIAELEQVSVLFTNGAERRLVAANSQSAGNGQRVVFGFETADDHSLDGLSVVDAEGRVHELSQWWQTVSLPNNDPDGVYLTIPPGQGEPGQGERWLKVRWWLEEE